MSQYLLHLLLGASGILAIPYDQYILAPPSRVIRPVSVYAINGTVTGAESLTVDDADGTANISSPDAAITFDYGKNIAGIVSFTVAAVSATEEYIGITFSESSLWISGKGSDAMADSGIDETLWYQIKEAGTYTVHPDNERGAFKYMSLVHNTTGWVELSEVVTNFTAMPHWEDNKLREYSGYFHSDDELLNRVWYAGAYTNQLCTIDPTHGNSLVYIGNITSDMPGDEVGTLPWYLNYTITNGTSALVDGAKRDRLVWAGDMAIAVPGIVASTNDLISVQNSLNSLFAIQEQNGQLPYAGVPFPSIASQTYHMYTLIGIADYYLYSNDSGYLNEIWPSVKLGVDYILDFIDDTGLMNVESPNDWLRFGMGGHNIEANSILYYTLYQLSALANAVNDSDSSEAWIQIAETLKTNANDLLWDDQAGFYRDNETTNLYPQDGNSWAVVSNLTLSSEQASSISSNLVKRWTPYGAPAPEAIDAVSPFISGFELQAHVLAGNATAALDLIRLQWGFMLDDPRMTNSTFIEGYSTSGEIHYAPYRNDPRISFAHGWATGPTSTLTFLIAGIQLNSAGGQTWTIRPNLGDLQTVEAGFETGIGRFSINNTKIAGTNVHRIEFETPDDTTGSLDIARLDCDGTLAMTKNGVEVKNLAVEKAVGQETRFEVPDLDGGRYDIALRCS